MVCLFFSLGWERKRKVGEGWGVLKEMVGWLLDRRGCVRVWWGRYEGSVSFICSILFPFLKEE